LTQEEKDAARLAKNLAQRARKPKAKTQHEQKNTVKEKDRLRKRGKWQALTQEQKNARYEQRQLCRKRKAGLLKHEFSRQLRITIIVRLDLAVVYTKRATAPASYLFPPSSP
jgi:hypothetical protein